jgi:hypothetical protein
MLVPGCGRPVAVGSGATVAVGVVTVGGGVALVGSGVLVGGTVPVTGRVGVAVVVAFGVLSVRVRVGVAVSAGDAPWQMPAGHVSPETQQSASRPHASS